MPTTTRAPRANKLKIVGGKYVSAKAKIGGECSKAMSAWKSSKSGMPAGVGKILGKCRAQAHALRKGVMYREAGQELKAQVQEHRALHGTVGVAARAAEARTKIEARKQAQAARAKSTGPTGPSLRDQVAIARGKKGTREERLKAALGRTTARAAALYDASKGNAREDSATRAQAYEAFTRGKTTSARAAKLETAIKGAPPAVKPTVKEQVATSRAKDIRRATPESLAAAKAMAASRREKASQSRFEHKREVAYEGFREGGRVPKPEKYKTDLVKTDLARTGQSYKTVKTPMTQAEIDAATAKRSRRAKDILEARAAFTKTPEAQARIKTQEARATERARTRFPLFGGKLPHEIPHEQLAQARATAERLRAGTNKHSTPGHAGDLAGGREMGIGTPTLKAQPEVQKPGDFGHLSEFGEIATKHHPAGSPAHLSSTAGQKLSTGERTLAAGQYAKTHAAPQAPAARAQAETRAGAFHDVQVKRVAAEGKPVESGHIGYKERAAAVAKIGSEHVAKPGSLEAEMRANMAKAAAAAKPVSHGLSDEVVAQHGAPYQGRHDSYMTHADAQAGYPETLKRLRAYSPEQLTKERNEMLKASHDRMFGHNARKALTLVESVQYEKQKLAGAGVAAPVAAPAAVAIERAKAATGAHGTVGHSGPLAGGRETGIGTKSLREQVAAKRAKKGTREERLASAYERAKGHAQKARTRTDAASHRSGVEQEKLARFEKPASDRAEKIRKAHEEEKTRIYESSPEAAAEKRHRAMKTAVGHAHAQGAFRKGTTEAIKKLHLGAGFKKKTVGIYNEDTEKRVPTEAYVKGDLAVHKALGGANTYSVTHAPTGLAIVHGNTLARAREIAGLLHRRKVDLAEVAKGPRTSKEYKYTKHLMRS